MKAFHNTYIVKSSFEIEALAKQLNSRNQSYVLNTINTLLFCQQSDHKKGKELVKR